MASQQKVNEVLATKEKPQDLKTLIESSAKELGKALPEHMRPERLVRIALTAIRLNPALAQCTPESFLGALFTSAQLGLEPVASQAYLIPFNNKRKVGNEWKTFKECQFVMGYGGLVSLFYRHEKACTISWGIVCEHDYFEYEKGTDPFLKHKEAQGDRGKVIGYYAVAHLQGGGKLFEYMTHIDAIEHGKKHSKTWDSKENKFYDASPWAKDTQAMCLKTVLKKLGKLLPLSYELQRAIQADETSREYRKGIDDALDLPTTSSWENEEKPIEKEVEVKSEDVPDFISPPTTQEILGSIPPIEPPKPLKSKTKNFEFLKVMKNQKERVGDDVYYKILGQNGYEHADEITEKEAQKAIYKELVVVKQNES